MVLARGVIDKVVVVLEVVLPSRLLYLSCRQNKKSMGENEYVGASARGR